MIAVLEITNQVVIIFLVIVRHAPPQNLMAGSPNK
jgi:hypothetical protein